MNKIWIVLFVISIFSICLFDPTKVLTGLLTASNSAVKLSFELCAIYAIWIGIFSILEQSGLSKKVSKLLSPIINKIFGKNNLSEESKKIIEVETKELQENKLEEAKEVIEIDKKANN